MAQINERVIVSLDLQDMDAVVKAWLKQRIKWTEDELTSLVYPDDLKECKKDLKAFNRILAYIGEL